MANDLEIKIRTVLEGNGLKLTDDQIKSFTRSSQQAEQASARTGRAAKDAGDAIHQFGRRGSEAKDAFEGLSNVARGGEGAIFGLAKAWRALTAAFAANPITAALALILGLLPLIQKGFDLWASSAEKARDAMFGTGEQTRAVEEKVKSLREATDKYIKDAQEGAGKLRDSWARINQEIDGTLNRFKQVEGARADAEKSGLELARQKALAGAKTQEQRDKINAQYDAKVAAVDSGSKKAISIQEDNANMMKEYSALESADAAKAKLDEADANVEKARRAEAEARRSGKPIAQGMTLSEAIRARDGAYAQYEKEYITMSSAAKDANSSLVASKYRSQAENNSLQIGAIQRGAAVADKVVDPNRRAELEARARSAQSSGNFAEQDAAVAELRKMNQAAVGFSKAVKQSGAAVAAALEDAKKATSQTKAAIKRTQQAGPGGGG